MTPIEIAALTFRTLCEICTKLARTYAQFLSRSCNTCNKYFKDILDSVSQFNGCYIVGDDIERNVLSIILLFCAQLTFDLISESQGHFQTLHPPIFTTYIQT